MNPVSSTKFAVGMNKISDGKAVDVTVPQNTSLKAGDFAMLDGFFGLVPINVKTEAGETVVIPLQIDQVEYATDQITVAQAFAKGTKCYWDAATNKLTETASTNRLVGIVTNGKSASNVIDFLLGPQI
ncbi:DUF2190 family protein [Cohnella nanjingensis]|uniref:DUF2190 family protein n=1 Tax=Cohnella nanjingensis TaxID=1387779 RepID=A0A7X0RT39_9BACL|nr:DUF2190 family protein [Cohnella nanjingensis]MBB6673011.1 DUF2190 family protein [Cohnella nanjingensis]